jgi:hypothetical protein
LIIPKDIALAIYWRGNGDIARNSLIARRESRIVYQTSLINKIVGIYIRSGQKYIWLCQFQVLKLFWEM